MDTLYDIELQQPSLDLWSAIKSMQKLPLSSIIKQYDDIVGKNACVWQIENLRMRFGKKMHLIQGFSSKTVESIQLLLRVGLGYDFFVKLASFLPIIIKHDNNNHD